MYHYSKKGFTLIEVLFVCVICALLTVIALNNFGRSSDIAKARVLSNAILKLDSVRLDILIYNSETILENLNNTNPCFNPSKSFRLTIDPTKTPIIDTLKCETKISTTNRGITYTDLDDYTEVPLGTSLFKKELNEDFLVDLARNYRSVSDSNNLGIVSSMNKSVIAHKYTNGLILLTYTTESGSTWTLDSQ